MNTTNTSAITEQCENRKGILLVADLEMRDYFAAKAMQALCGQVGFEDAIAKCAYEMADAMLKERAKPCS